VSIGREDQLRKIERKRKLRETESFDEVKNENELSEERVPTSMKNFSELHANCNKRQ